MEKQKNSFEIGIIILGLIFLLLTSVNAEVAGEYLFLPYGIDVNVGNFVALADGKLDVNRTATCHLTAKYQPTNQKVLDSNLMSASLDINGFYTIKLPLSDTSFWKKGKYDGVMDCYQGDLNGTENLSFLIDVNNTTGLSDLNTFIANELNEIQNQLDNISAGVSSNQVCEFNLSTNFYLGQYLQIALTGFDTNHNALTTGTFNLYKGTKQLVANKAFSVIGNNLYYSSNKKINNEEYLLEVNSGNCRTSKLIKND